MFKWLFLALLWAAPAAAQNVTCPTRPNGDSTNACASTAFVQSAIPTTSANANSVLGNATGSTAPATSLAVPSCSTSASALAYTTNTGFSCNSAVNAAQLGGATFASPGAIGGSTPAAGSFTTLSGSTSVSGGTGSFTTLALSNTATLAAGTTSIAPLKFQSGTNLTSAAAGALEYDGTVGYLTNNASNRGVWPSEQFVVLTSTRTFTSNTNPQAIFAGGGGPTNGQITLPTGTYFYEFGLNLGTISSTSGRTLNLTFAGTSTIATVMGTNSYGTSASGASIGTKTSAAASGLAISFTGDVSTAAQVTGWGVFTITVAGTFIPQLTQSVASAMTVAAGSYFRLHQVGASNVAFVGNWN